jgi:recombination protein RecR
MKYPPHLITLIEVLKKLPGIGNKSAERFAFELLTWSEDELANFADIVKTIPHHLKYCIECGCLISPKVCSFCQSNRDSNVICIIASPKDAFAIEETREFKGLYHVLGGVLSPLNGLGPDSLLIDKLKERVISLNVKELVIALDSTLEGDATALYLKQELYPFNLNVSRLAFGLPMGCSLDYVDGGTLARAFSARRTF